MKPMSPPMSPVRGTLVDEANTQLVQRLQLVGYPLDLEADVVQSLSPAGDVGGDEGCPGRFLQQFQVSLAHRHEAAAHADVLAAR